MQELRAIEAKRVKTAATVRRVDFSMGMNV
jgi:hypothetical protein